MRSPRTPVALVLTFLIAGFVAACGASGGSDASEATTTTVQTTTTTEDDTTTSSKRTTTTEGRTTTTRPVTPSTMTRSDDAQAYVDALAATYEEAGADFFTKPQATCIAGAYLDAVGLDALRGAGISPEDFAESNGDDFDGKVTLTEAMGGQIFDRFEPCGVDFSTLFRQLSGPGALTPAQDACFDRILTPDNLRRSFVADYTGNELADDPLDQLDDCTDIDG